MSVNLCVFRTRPHVQFDTVVRCKFCHRATMGNPPRDWHFVNGRWVCGACIKGTPRGAREGGERGHDGA